MAGVEVEASGDGYRFSVTLYPDDAGEDGYANWWQVETLDGAPCVVVRGHDQSHGYGGQAILVSLDDGATEPVRQGPEPKSFADADCP